MQASPDGRGHAARLAVLSSAMAVAVVVIVLRRRGDEAYFQEPSKSSGPQATLLQSHHVWHHPSLSTVGPTGYTPSAEPPVAGSGDGASDCGVNRTVEPFDADAFDARAFCARYGYRPRADVPRVLLGLMFSYEYDMLEVMLHELYPVVDEVYIAESETSHSLQRKAAAL